MGELIWSLVLFVHIPAAAFWVGGQLMLAVVTTGSVRASTPTKPLETNLPDNRRVTR
jgi:putative copper export protein